MLAIDGFFRWHGLPLINLTVWGLAIRIGLHPAYNHLSDFNLATVLVPRRSPQ